MKLYIGKRLLDMDEKELDKLYLNEGSEGNLYRLGNEVLKIYKDNPLISKLSKEDIEFLSKLKLKRFVVPNEVISDEEGTTLGYSANYLEEDKFDKIYSMDSKHLKEEISLLLDDIRILSMNGIELADLHLSNLMISNNKIYFLDFGSFVRTNEDFDELYMINKYIFEQFIVNVLFASSLSKKNRKKLGKEFNSRIDLISFLDEMDDGENIKNFSKKVIR